MAQPARRPLITDYSRDYYGGALIILIGLAAAWQGESYEVGTLTRMGAGFFPVALGVTLTLLGIAIAVGARRARPTLPLAVPLGAPQDAALRPEWRGWCCISLSVVAFVVMGRYGGLLPAAFAITFISALGDRENTLSRALVLATAISVICVVVFWWALRLQLPLFAWG
jgi:hypothetical protein